MDTKYEADPEKPANDEQIGDIKFHLDDAKLATSKEHGLTVLQGLKPYRKAIGWSVMLSMAVIMEGYDTTLVVDGVPSISAPWQAAVTNGAYIGEILGLQVTGYLVDWYGNKKVMTGATILMIGFIALSFFGMSLGVQLAGQILCGIPWGVYQTVTTVYAAEVMPVNLRGYLTSIPFAVQWIWPIPLILVCIFCPESPTWLVEHGRNEEAEKAVARLQSNTGVDIPAPHETVALLAQTNAFEKELTAGVGYMECFKGTNLRRTEITVGTWVAQQMCGPVLQTYAIYFFEQAGLPTAQAFNMTLGLVSVPPIFLVWADKLINPQYAIAFVGTVLSWPLINRFGRRTIYLWGMTGIVISLLLVGFISLAPVTSGSSWAIGAFLLVFTFIYDSTVGPLTYVIVPETPSSRLRHKTVVLARNAYNITCIWTGVLTPYMLNTTAWNWSAKTGFFWAGFAILCLIWAYFRIPETKGFTFSEIDVLFEEGVPARKFAAHRGEVAERIR
ncbi:hypothetical protein LTR91_021879 [Friedmanniomyces endolithicus]|uniref:Major facilitator superfamily (MFS) profile domain-containing protein n=1 Tax=Friedmanniomyces endolithicus TaxID=329885 RepID=A0AAN6HBT3_9PEZI|nr:hypothetical protein LTR94_009313 [Friedmanniomyces endolithicus]KAK0798032.1 hypothetical protein LTR38_008026 [Friedmanniomyces endolithicus]KAK0813700.1 hypothetical protein LTR75_004513 [Friedmanniomyces endolithicus]KAK0881031.1 hypothetical protein LTR87_005152 [Friedmanniomyces endolithicus]KAK0905223.1 hypothetical protein LTR02_006607 [Friedmanniomyces endolithicus]